MTTVKLPREVDFEKMAQTRAHLVGELPLSNFTRLSSWLANDIGLVRVDIHFSRDGKGLAECRGEIKLQCNLSCQRCLNVLPLAATVEVGLVAVRNTDEALALNSALEPVITGGEVVSLIDLVEDEVLLLLPQSPKHLEDECSVDMALVNRDLSTEPDWQGKLKEII